MAPGSVTVVEVDTPTVVMGSAQRPDVLAESALQWGGFDCVQRRTGGGLVVLIPGEHVWVDVQIGREDPLWCEDVSRSFDWLAERWVAAFADHGIAGEAHTGPSAHADLGRTVCFAGIGSGEVLVDGRKAVGMCQRRTRDAALFQILLHSRFRPEQTLSVVSDSLRSEGLERRLHSSVAALESAELVLRSFLDGLTPVE
jgi:lipoate-protein ligase A